MHDVCCWEKPLTVDVEAGRKQRNASPSPKAVLVLQSVVHAMVQTFPLHKVVTLIVEFVCWPMFK
jgi:hypothetical protein